MSSSLKNDKIFIVNFFYIFLATLNINFKTSLIKYAEIFKKKFNVLSFKMLTLFVKLFKKQEKILFNIFRKKRGKILSTF